MSKLTSLLAGRKITQVLKNERMIVIQCEDNFEARIVWADEHGVPLAGEPQLIFAGVNIVAKPELVRLPCGVSFSEVIKDMRRAAAKKYG